MIEPITLAGVCKDVYADEPQGFAHLWDYEGCHAGHRRIGDVDVIVFRGSKDREDWLRDVEVFPLWDYRLGFVHSGFMTGVNEILVAASMVTGDRVCVTGHSLGGARARLFAAMLAYNSRPAVQCCVFGSPRPGFSNVRRVLEKSGTPLASYRNRRDPVTLVPYLAGMYEHPDEWIALDVAPAPDDLGPLRDHNIDLYIEGLQKLATAHPEAQGEAMEAISPPDVGV